MRGRPSRYPNSNSFIVPDTIAIRCYTEMLRTLLLGLAATASAQTLDDLYTITPVGKILSHCVHEVNEGAHSVEQVSGGLDGGTT